MISQILEHLDGLQIELSTIDPAQTCDAANRVAELATALRHTLPDPRKRNSDPPAFANLMSAAAWTRQIPHFTRSPS